MAQLGVLQEVFKHAVRSDVLSCYLLLLYDRGTLQWCPAERANLVSVRQEGHMYSSTLPALSSVSSFVGGAIPFACVSLFPHRQHAGLLTCRKKSASNSWPLTSYAHILRSCPTHLGDEDVLSYTRPSMSL